METKKRVYVGLLLASLFLSMAILIGMGFLFKNRNIIISQILLFVIVMVIGIIFLLLGIGIMSMVIMIVRSKTTPSLESMAAMVNVWLFPFALAVGRILGISRDSILSSFISVNNFMVRSKNPKLVGEQVMLLIPHCLQDSACPRKITLDINNCKECGKCKIGELKQLCQQEHAMIKVASGGTLARKFIKENKPRGIVAVACERDLSLGIQDAGIIPVLGVLNCRPNGPCINTDVDLDKILQAMRTITGQGFNHLGPEDSYEARKKNRTSEPG